MLLKNYLSENLGPLNTRIYVSDFDAPDKFRRQTVMFASGETVGSPMGGNHGSIRWKTIWKNLLRAKMLQY